jgi:hypothetical protein
MLHPSIRGRMIIIIIGAFVVNGTLNQWNRQRFAFDLIGRRKLFPGMVRRVASGIRIKDILVSKRGNNGLEK